MNLTITPVNFKNTHTPKFNNQNQNFSGLRAQFQPHTKIARQADMILDKFLYHFEQTAKRIGLDTEKLEKKGYVLVLDSTKTEDMDCGVLSGILQNKKGEVVKQNGKSINCIILDTAEPEYAAKFANTINRLKISA